MEGFGLLVGHLIGDYVLQNDWQARNKTNPYMATALRPGTWVYMDGGGMQQPGSLNDAMVWDDTRKKWWLGHLACTVHCLLYTLAVWACSFWWVPWWGLVVLLRGPLADRPLPPGRLVDAKHQRSEGVCGRPVGPMVRRRGGQHLSPAHPVFDRSLSMRFVLTILLLLLAFLALNARVSAQCPAGCPCGCSDTQLCTCEVAKGDQKQAALIRTRLTRDSYYGQQVWPPTGKVVWSGDGWATVPFVKNGDFVSASKWFGWPAVEKAASVNALTPLTLPLLVGQHHAAELPQLRFSAPPQLIFRDAKKVSRAAPKRQAARPAPISPRVSYAPVFRPVPAFAFVGGGMGGCGAGG